ncbi:PH domain-containing protein [Allokutzneria albata]|uniref:PH domain-containing protein n=1 Tax=Allokutzneria albata TaxID=211114 RepID=UPI00138E39F5|nr:PH domain-containing protein [Allokutzneria albata]
MIIPLSIFGFVGFAMIVYGAVYEKVLGGIFFTGAVVLAAVKLREAVVLRPGGLVVREWFRSRRIESDQVVAVEVDSWRSALWVPFSFPVLRLSDGSTVPLDVLKAPGAHLSDPRHVTNRRAEDLRSHVTEG